MAYTTPSAVRLVLTADGNPTDPSTAAGLDDATLNGPCQQASDEVDARLSARYQVPLPAVPAVVADITTDIAAYLATLTYRGGQPVDSTDPMYLRYQRALGLLKDITTGAATLPSVEAGAPQGSVVTANPVPDGLFTPEDFDLWPALPDRWQAGPFPYRDW